MRRSSPARSALPETGSSTWRRSAERGCPTLSTPVWTCGWLAQYGGGIFLPIHDATSGRQSYGGGRYLLDTAKGADLGGDERTIVVDLNFVYHPSCRYNSRWECPLAPEGNRLNTPVRAGERLSVTEHDAPQRLP